MISLILAYDVEMSPATSAICPQLLEAAICGETLSADADGASEQEPRMYDLFLAVCKTCHTPPNIIQIEANGEKGLVAITDSIQRR